MAVWIIVPTKSVNGIKFGTERKVVREKIAMDYTEFKKNKFSVNTSDNYGSFHIFFDEQDRFEAIELFKEEVVVIKDTKVFPCSVSDIGLMADDFVEDAGNYISKNKSIGLTVANGMVEAALFGYFDYYEE
ncbi:MAG: hypothetical protein Q4A54_02280 [Parabacteroides sp.]|nr:hypothetical protein [Parabacteroides sp.]